MNAQPNGKFSSYVTSTAFSLSLSKNMIDELARAVEDDGYVWFNRGTGLYGLERRGLVTVEAVPGQSRQTTHKWADGPTVRYKITATRAGKLSYLLCVEAGLIPDNGHGDVSAAVAAIEMEFSKLDPEPIQEPV